MMIQKLRLKRGWSQQQLAEFSGLSVRTIQRIEAGQPPSLETLKSLAAVFEVALDSLKPLTETSEMSTTAHAAAAAPAMPPIPPSPQDTTDRAEQEAFEHVTRLRKFYLHVIRYLIVVSGLTVINLLTSPHRLWVLWVMLGWGIGLVSHGARVFVGRGFLGPEWERRQVEKRLGRPL
jgi:transcriptional regulator with XRE-family HTH domain